MPHAVCLHHRHRQRRDHPSYSYDANGNMTAGAGRSVTYTAFNMASAITQGSTTTNFWYDPEHNRVRMYVSGVYVQGYDSDPVSGAMEEYRIAGSTTTWSDYIKADDQLVAMRSCTGGPPCTSGGTWTYFVTDELGTVVRATDSTGDPTSAHTERNAYDPWGRHRLIGGGDDATCGATPASKTTRGYTGHEQLNDLCLINANARIYDPTIARFMTPDTMVSDPANVQDWNPYTYVNNRPMTLTDPTGHEDVAQDRSPTGQQKSALADLADLDQRLSNNPTLSVMWGSGAAQEFKDAGIAASAITAQLAATGRYGAVVTGAEAQIRRLPDGAHTVQPDVQLDHRFNTEGEALATSAKAIDDAAKPGGYKVEFGAFTVGKNGGVYNTAIGTNGSPDGVFWDLDGLDKLFKDYTVMDYVHSHPDRTFGWQFSIDSDQPLARQWYGMSNHSFHGYYLDYKGDFKRYMLPTGGTRDCGPDPNALLKCGH